MDIICFSHLRWDFVFQRPQHIMSRFVQTGRVFYVEEHFFHDEADTLLLHQTNEGVNIVVPYLNQADSLDIFSRIESLLCEFFTLTSINKPVLWYYTPMALRYSEFIKASAVVYDCMDELSAFKFAPPELAHYEKKLFDLADVVFTGGRSLYENKKKFHTNVYLFPSAIDRAHFGQARKEIQDPEDQQQISGPRFGFFGVIDERFDIELIREVSTRRPDWQFIFLGPVVKIHESDLPKNSNVHYLGMKAYDELPLYLANWDIALIPFAINESTKYISPTKTPEYLAAGKQVISTPIVDVVNPYGVLGLVKICYNANQFIEAAEELLSKQNDEVWLKNVDVFLEDISWDTTWSNMREIISKKLSETFSNTQKANSYV